MKLKLDENLPVALATALTQLGFDVDTVQSEGLEGKPDGHTQYLEFSDIRRFALGTHASARFFD